jgi:hypothetical protein
LNVLDSSFRQEQADVAATDWGKGGRMMKPVRVFCVAVLGIAFALAASAVAQANEVTKWNDIAVATVNAQPPITSAPPAGSIFVAMVQGAVYGAVNAVDRHGKPYLVNRSFPKASADAAAATAAFRVLDSLFSATHHATLLAAYNESLGAIPDGDRTDQGIAVGEMAAAAMLAEGHDGRAVIGCTFGSGLLGVWQPLANPRRQKFQWYLSFQVLMSASAALRSSIANRRALSLTFSDNRSTNLRAIAL